MSAPVDLDVLPETVWRARQSAHEARVDGWLAPMQERARRGDGHPVEDFLFTYYTFRPRQLRRWSPGIGVVLEVPVDAPACEEFVPVRGGVTLRPPGDRVRTAAEAICQLLDRTAARPPQFGCFGLHEWAMVHRQQAQDLRHREWPLRLGAAGTDKVVETLPLRCTHFDAFRFFTPSARGLNALQPARATQHEMEQGGCLHANMDLYKWAFKLFPWVPAELVADCFHLARRVRELDMRASPYDLSALGYSPVPIETAEGRRDYVEAQRGFAAEAASLRLDLHAAAARLLSRTPA